MDDENYIAVRFKDRSEVMTRSMFGEYIVHPEFCETECNQCGRTGYVSTTALDHAYDEELDVVCTLCGCEHDRINPHTIEIVSVEDTGAEIEAHCADCDARVYQFLDAEDMEPLSDE